MWAAILKDKYAIIIGDRDGVPGPAIEECAKTAGAKIAYSSIECFCLNVRRCHGSRKPEEGF